MLEWQSITWRKGGALSVSLARVAWHISSKGMRHPNAAPRAVP